MAPNLIREMAGIKYFWTCFHYMRSVREAFTTIAFTLMLIAVPWTVSGDSGESDFGLRDTITVDASATIKDDIEVEYDVEFNNLDEDIEYQYEIWFTRVDPDFSHFTVSGSFTSDSDHENVKNDWTPDQDGPYTLHATISEYGNLLASNRDTFDWGDAANNGAPADVLISANPMQRYYEVIGNESRQNNITFSFDGTHTEIGANYKLEWELYHGSEINESNSLIGATYTNLHIIQNMSGLGSQIDGWEQDTEYTFGAWLYRIDGTGDDLSDHLVDSDEWSFVVGSEDEPLIALQFSCPTDVDNPWTIPLNNTLIQNNAEQHSLQCDVRNPNEVEVSGNHSIQIEQGSGMTFTATPSGQFTLQPDESTYVLLTPQVLMEENPPTAEGVLLLKALIGADGWIDAQSAIRIHYLLEDEEPVVDPPPVAVLFVDSSANVSSGDAPLEVLFGVDVSGGEEPYLITWSIGETVISNSAMFTYTFDSVGDYMVKLVVTDDSGQFNGSDLFISVSAPPPADPLSGVVSLSPQLNASALVVNASIEMQGFASGGEEPYSFYWDFGDGGSDIGENVSHIFAETGNYTVTLTVVDANDQIDADTIQVNITVAKDDLDKVEDDSKGEPSHVDESRSDEKIQLALTSGGALGLFGLFGLGHWRSRNEKADMLEKARGELQSSNDADSWSSDVGIEEVGELYADFDNDDFEVDLDLIHD